LVGRDRRERRGRAYCGFAKRDILWEISFFVFWHLISASIVADRLTATPGEVTRLLIEFRNGRESASRLVSLVYDELRRIARSYMRKERREHTLTPTALVHEAYLKLIEQRAMNWQNRAHFFAVASRLMRRILIDYAREHRSGKRGGRIRRVSLDDAPPVFLADRCEELIALDEALSTLETSLPRQSRIVELRYFGGLTVEETAAVLGIAPKTVKRDWSVARVWLHREFLTNSDDGSRKVGEAGRNL
jgi:RNA polymerase sigma factor (TIGR02999 family)